MGVAKKTPAQQEAAWAEAYERRRDGENYAEIHAAMAGAPHFCGGKSTAIRWVREGRAFLAAKGDPMRKHHARREMTIDAFDALRVQLAQDVKAQNIDRDDFYKHTIRILELAAKIGGYQAPALTARVKVSGRGGRAASVDPALIDGLAAMLGQDPDELIEALLPDGRTEP